MSRFDSTVFMGNTAVITGGLEVIVLGQLSIALRKIILFCTVFIRRTKDDSARFTGNYTCRRKSILKSVRQRCKPFTAINHLYIGPAAGRHAIVKEHVFKWRASNADA